MAIKKYDGKPIPPIDPIPPLQDFWGKVPNDPNWRGFVKGQLLDLTENWDNETGDPEIASETGLSIVDSLQFGTLQLGVTDHGELTGLGDDDHPHYLTQGRGDTRYSQLTHFHRIGVDRLDMGAGIISTIQGQQWTSLNPVSVTGFLGGTLVNNDYNVPLSGWYQVNAKITIYSPVACGGQTRLRLNGADWQPASTTLVPNAWQTVITANDVAYLPANSKLRLAIYFDNTRSDNTYIKQDPWTGLHLLLLEKTI